MSLWEQQWWDRAIIAFEKLLSIDEAKGFFSTKNSLVCKPTKTAIVNGKHIDDSGACSWWLRLHEGFCDCAVQVGEDGGIFVSNILALSINAVRPVVVIDVNRDNFHTDTELSSRYSTLSKGSKGEDVQRLQEALIYARLLEGKADGDFGKKTEEAVKKAQKAFGMEETGIADDAFQKKLYGE